MRPAQLVRQRRTNWVTDVQLTNSHQIAATKPLAMAQGQIAAEA